MFISNVQVKEFMMTCIGVIASVPLMKLSVCRRAMISVQVEYSYIQFFVYFLTRIHFSFLYSETFKYSSVTKSHICKECSTFICLSR